MDAPPKNYVVRAWGLPLIPVTNIPLDIQNTNILNKKFNFSHHKYVESVDVLFIVVTKCYNMNLLEVTNRLKQVMKVYNLVYYENPLKNMNSLPQKRKDLTPTLKN